LIIKKSIQFYSNHPFYSPNPVVLKVFFYNLTIYKKNIIIIPVAYGQTVKMIDISIVPYLKL